MRTAPRTCSILLLALTVAGGFSRTAAGSLNGYYTEESTARSAIYRSGQKALSEERWSEALQIFTSLADSNPAEADAALYWKAWTEAKLGRKAEALKTLRGFDSTYPQSPWADDAKALILELKGGKKGPDDPVIAGSAAGDEDLKLYALDGLMQVEPERAVPILERFLAANHSLKLKERALFVLAQSGSPRARQILLDIVRSGTPVELRLEAVEQLGISGDDGDLLALQTIWKDGTFEVKRKVLEAWMIAGEAEPVIQVAKTESDPELRRRAIEMLGVMGETDALTALYDTEKSHEVRRKLLEAYGVAGDIDALERAARNEKDPDLRRRAIEGIGVFGDEKGADILVDLYRRESDRSVKRKILEAMMVNGAARQLVALFRAEKDPDLKRLIVQQLSLVDDEEAEKVLSEILGDGQ
jgi:HEAT repeat protein